MVAVASDTLDDPRRSTMRLFENGKPLDPHADLVDVEFGRGSGVYSVWADAVVLTAADNCDSRSKGWIYTATGLLKPAPRTIMIVTSLILARATIVLVHVGRQITRRRTPAD
jgi:hypothetical protein